MMFSLSMSSILMFLQLVKTIQSRERRYTPTNTSHCNWSAINNLETKVVSDPQVGSPGIPVFWINMAESVSRRMYMEKLLSSASTKLMGIGKSERVQAITPSDPKFNISMLEMPCKRNTPRDLAVILSHLTAMYRAVHDNSTYGNTSKYALILEDDVAFTLHTDFMKLILSAPLEFGILQLISSCREAVNLMWRQFMKSDGRELWTYNHWTNTTKDRRYPLFWSAQAYIINKSVVKGFLDDVITMHSNGSLSFKIINSFFPKHCTRTPKRPCILANCLFSDSYIFAGAGPTYVSNIPIFNGGDIGRVSTIHQEQVERVHLPAFDLIRQTVHSLKEQVEKSLASSGNRGTLPPYILSPKCYFPS